MIQGKGYRRLWSTMASDSDSNANNVGCESNGEQLDNCDCSSNCGNNELFCLKYKLTQKVTQLSIDAGEKWKLIEKEQDTCNYLLLKVVS